MDPLAEWYSGTVRHEAPFAVRRFRHRDTGEEALLTLGLAHPPGVLRNLAARRFAPSFSSLPRRAFAYRSISDRY
jgi:hypothetical protein